MKREKQKRQYYTVEAKRDTCQQDRLMLLCNPTVVSSLPLCTMLIAVDTVRVRALWHCHRTFRASGRLSASDERDRESADVLTNEDKYRNYLVK